LHRLHGPIRTLFFLPGTAPTEVYTLSLHDALPIYRRAEWLGRRFSELELQKVEIDEIGNVIALWPGSSTADDSTSPSTKAVAVTDRKSTRLNSSHSQISYAVFCLKKKNIRTRRRRAWAGNAGSLQTEMIQTSACLWSSRFFPLADTLRYKQWRPYHGYTLDLHSHF